MAPSGKEGERGGRSRREAAGREGSRGLGPGKDRGVLGTSEHVPRLYVQFLHQRLADPVSAGEQVTSGRDKGGTVFHTFAFLHKGLTARVTFTVDEQETMSVRRISWKSVVVSLRQVWQASPQNKFHAKKVDSRMQIIFNILIIVQCFFLLPRFSSMSLIGSSKCPRTTDRHHLAEKLHLLLPSSLCISRAGEVFRKLQEPRLHPWRFRVSLQGRGSCASEKLPDAPNVQGCENRGY